MRAAVLDAKLTLQQWPEPEPGPGEVLVAPVREGIVRSLEAARIVAVDPRPDAWVWALSSGADVALHPDDALAAITAEGGVDNAFEFVGRPETVELAARSLDAGGTAVAVGIGRGKVQASHLSPR
jgi:threonine dehydrogenase-like Zn-dependent dehydrogenase